MGTKMKGLLKGLRYISQIFDDGKEPEMQIGYPTDVKHVAHIGWDGPSVDSPSWMKKFNSPPGFQSVPLNINGEVKENPEIKWVSEDSNQRSSRAQNSPAKDLPKSLRHHSLPDGSLTSETITRDSSTKSRRRQSSKEPLDSSLGAESPSRNLLPNIPKKSRQKKSKEPVSGGSSRSKASTTCSTLYTSAFSDPGPESGSISIFKNKEICQTCLNPLIREEDKEGT
uniref:Putative CRIB domain-containing protein RIC7-like n=1 Tax=Davidia involucrata TaxID=16924 RepID=A0A5B6ZVP1_DAVIN